MISDSRRNQERESQAVSLGRVYLLFPCPVELGLGGRVVHVVDSCLVSLSVRLTGEKSVLFVVTEANL